MSVTRKGNFISETGYRYDSKNHKTEQMDRGQHMQFPMLRGPIGMPWQIHEKFSESARGLLDSHRENAFLACYALGRFRYCRYLGLHVADRIRVKYKNQWKTVLKKTKRGLTAGTGPSQRIERCRKFLVYLGDLHVQVVRCLENGVILKSIVKDLRACNLDLFTQYLDQENVPQTNEQNPYRAILNNVADPYYTISNVWLQQDDKQIERLHHELGV